MHASKFVESYIDAWSHGDPEGVAEHLTPDGTYCDIPEDMQRSPIELVIFLTDFFTRYRNRYELTGEILTSKNSVAFQYNAYPHDDDCDQPGVSFCGAEFMTLNGDAAITITDYYDIPGFTVLSETVGRQVTAESQCDKYAKSGLDSDHLSEYKERLEHIMISDQAFLWADLTLPKLATEVGCSVNHLSQVINSGFGVSFFDYLNRYRIKHAQMLLTRLDSECSAILNIAFTVGFNSNSAFYAAFKKHVGETPAQYRRACIKASN